MKYTFEDHEIERHRAARHKLTQEFQAFGIMPAVDLEFFASELPDEEVLYALAEQVHALARRSSHGRAEAYDALNQVIRARDTYDREVRQQPVRQIRLNRDLAAIAKLRQPSDILQLLDRRQADPQRGPALLVALWKGALAAKLARPADQQTEAHCVKVKGKWNEVRGDTELALRCLAEDPVAFAAAARRGLDQHKFVTRDWSRPLRGLVAHPTRRRFEAILKRHGNANDQDVYLPSLRRAARRLFGGNLTVNWREKVAADPEKIRAVAQGALEFLKLGDEIPGLPRDRAHDRYVKRLEEIYQGLTGIELTYNTVWPSSKLERRQRRFGPALTFVLLGLRLIDPGASEHQARDLIDEYRERLRQAKNT